MVGLKNKAALQQNQTKCTDALRKKMKQKKKTSTPIIIFWALKYEWRVEKVVFFHSKLNNIFHVDNKTLYFEISYIIDKVTHSTWGNDSLTAIIWLRRSLSAVSFCVDDSFFFVAFFVVLFRLFSHFDTKFWCSPLDVCTVRMLALDENFQFWNKTE